MLRSGNLNKRISIEQVTEAKTGSGSVTKTWSEYARPFASVEPMLGREYVAAQQVQAENQVRFRIRYDKGINTKMRISFEGGIYDIHSIINPFALNDEMLLMGVIQVD